MKILRNASFISSFVGTLFIIGAWLYSEANPSEWGFLPLLYIGIFLLAIGLLGLIYFFLDYFLD